MDLTLVPTSVGNETYFGSFSQKIAQYLACGVPVIAWETADTVFLDSRGVGRTVPRRDPAELADVIRQMVTSTTSNRTARINRIDVRHFATAELSAEVIARLRVRWWTDLVEGAAMHARHPMAADSRVPVVDG